MQSSVNVCQMSESFDVDGFVRIIRCGWICQNHSMWMDLMTNVSIGHRLPPGVQGKIRQLSCGGWHSCALLDDGALLTWGNNHFGQLGNGTFTGSSGNGEFGETWNDRLEPGYSTFWTNITQVSAGHYHNRELTLWTLCVVSATLIEHLIMFAWLSATVAILANGSVVAWGSNQAGQLGLVDDAPHMQVRGIVPLDLCIKQTFFSLY